MVTETTLPGVAHSAGRARPPRVDALLVHSQPDDADDRVGRARRLLMIAERRNAAATTQQIRRLRYAVSDAQEFARSEACPQRSPLRPV
jgi:hypothetical protein